MNDPVLENQTSENPTLKHQPVVFDRSQWGRIRLTGADRVRFLHNQTTNSIEQLSAGQGCYTVFVTSTGRTLDLATVYALSDSLLVTLSPGMTQQLYDWMDRYIFFSDKVTLTDESEQTFIFTVLGAGADQVMKAIGAADLIGQSPFSHQPVKLPDLEAEVTIAVGSDLAIAGYTLWGPQAIAKSVWQTLLSAGATAGSSQQWETLRIQQGRPMPSAELTDDDNPLEAGLWHSISFEKGCYIGQETIARLNTYKGVKKRLWGFALQNSVAPGTDIYEGGAKVGKVTSVTETEDGVVGLGYLRTKTGGEGLSIEVGGVKGEAIALPFVSHEYYAADSDA
ncbi:MAG: folate-binding protein [Phormidesmis sp.]